jgi:putative Holliday junction resolvase
MDGSETALTPACREFASELERRFGLPVELVDERLTSAAATAELREARRSGALGRRVHRGDIDANAARLLLETWMGAHSGSSGSGSR